MGLFDFLKPKKSKVTEKQAKKLLEEKPREVVHLSGPDTASVFVIDQEVLRGIKVGQPFEIKLSHLPTTIKHPTEPFVWKSSKEDGNTPVLYKGKPFGNVPGLYGAARIMFKQYKTVRLTATITRWKRGDDYPTVEVSIPERTVCMAFVRTAEELGTKYAKFGCEFHYMTIPEKCATDKIKTQCMPRPLTVTVGEANEGHRPPVMVAIGNTVYFRVHARSIYYETLLGLVGRSDCMARYDAVEKDDGGYKYSLKVAVGCNMPE